MCTHQVRNCNFKDFGCPFKVCQLLSRANTLFINFSKLISQGTLRDLAKHAQEYLACHTQLLKSCYPLVNARSAIARLQDGLSEVSLLLQTLQAASYDGTFIWRIPEVTRPRQEARTYQRGVYTAPVQERDPGASVMTVMSRSCGRTLTRLRQEARMFFSPSAQYTAPVQEHNPDASMTMVASRRW